MSLIKTVIYIVIYKRTRALCVHRAIVANKLVSSFFFFCWTASILQCNSKNLIRPIHIFKEIFSSTLFERTYMICFVFKGLGKI